VRVLPTRVRAALAAAPAGDFAVYATGSGGGAITMAGSREDRDPELANSEESTAAPVSRSDFHPCPPPMSMATVNRRS